MKQLTNKIQAMSNMQLEHNEKGSKFILLPAMLLCSIAYCYCQLRHSSSSNVIASRVVCNNSYSSLLPTIMFSNSLKPVPAGIG